VPADLTVIVPYGILMAMGGDLKSIAVRPAAAFDTPAEAEALYQDILINVTSFFRDAEAYEALKDTVFPRLTEHKSRQDAVRVWALGCSTGEEAYSLAMAYTEYAESSGRRVPLQIFATDLNGIGIERARAGIYSKGIAQDLSPERLRRFFVEIDGSYRISKPIRDMCVFARQNVLADPPFSRMDLIACRNLLIYLEPVLQHKLLPLLTRNAGPLPACSFPTPSPRIRGVSAIRRAASRREGVALLLAAPDFQRR